LYKKGNFNVLGNFTQNAIQLVTTGTASGETGDRLSFLSQNRHGKPAFQFWLSN